MPSAPALLMMAEEMVSVRAVSTATLRLPATVPPAVRRPAPEITESGTDFLMRPPLTRFSVRVAEVPRSTSARSVTSSPPSEVVPAFVSV